MHVSDLVLINVSCHCVESFTHSGRFAIVNYEYRGALSDKASEIYKTLSTLVKSGVGDY